MGHGENILMGVMDFHIHSLIKYHIQLLYGQNSKHK